MRKIKFRVWDKNRKIYAKQIISYKLDRNNEINLVVYLDKKNKQNEIFDSEKIMTNEFIIQQFTGLQDMQGNDIYEGDIVKLKPYTNNNISDYNKVVEYELYHCESPNAHSARWLPFDNSFSKCKIIGNIFDNPELMKE